MKVEVEDYGVDHSELEVDDTDVHKDDERK